MCGKVPASPDVCAPIAESWKAIGYVQATIRREDRTADLAWVIGARWWGRGYATEAASSAMGLLRKVDVAHFTAHISPGHVASERVAWKVGLRPTTRIVDSEVVWATGETSGP